MAQRTIHGVTLDVPDTFEDFSIFRFRAPRPPEAPGPLVAKRAVRLEPNIICTRHATDAPLAEVFAASNAEYASANPSFKLIAGGATTYLGQTAVWQDSQQVHLDAQVAAFQRHIAIARTDGAAGEYLLVVITGERADLDSLSAAIGFARQPG
jgi:hypothetical protein